MIGMDSSDGGSISAGPATSRSGNKSAAIRCCIAQNLNETDATANPNAAAVTIATGPCALAMP